MNAPTDHHVGLAPLIVELIDGELDAAGRGRLADLLRADVAARDAYLRVMALHGQLNWRQGDHAAAAMPLAMPIDRDGLRDRRWRVAMPMAIAAAVVIAGAAAAMYLAMAGGEPAPVQTPKPRTLATLTAAEDVVWQSQPLYAGESIGDETIRVDRGEVELLLDRGVMATARGAFEMRVDGPNAMSVIRGRASFDCPPRAKGFAVALPGGVRVVDLGTRFRVDMREGGAGEVSVTIGRVRIDAVGGSVIVAAPGTALIDGESVRSAEPLTQFADAFDGDALDAAWVWDSPGEATYGLATRPGWLRVAAPPLHSVWKERGLGPIAYVRSPLPERYSIETEVALVDVEAGMGSAAVYDVAAGQFAVSVGLIKGGPVRRLRLESPGVHLADVAYDGDRVELRLTRTSTGEWLGEYRAPGEAAWREFGRAEASAAPGDPRDFRAALMTKAWDQYPTTLDYGYLRVTGEHEGQPEPPVRTPESK